MVLIKNIFTKQKNIKMIHKFMYGTMSVGIVSIGIMSSITYGKNIKHKEYYDIFRP